MSESDEYSRMTGQHMLGGGVRTLPPPPTSRLHGVNLKEFLCGWGAAFVNISVTYPINKIMFRQMLHGVRFKRAFKDLRREGAYYLYRGVLPPLVQKTLSVSVMFGCYHHYQLMLVSIHPSINTKLCEMSAAMLAGTTEALLTPFERVQTILQDKNYHGRYQNSFHAFRELRVYGFAEYYRGLIPILIRNGPSNVLFFELRGTVKQHLPSTQSWYGNVLTDFVSGALVGALISTLFYPTNVIKTQMQSTVGGEFVSTRAAFHNVWHQRQRSLRRLFYGVHINYTRAVISWGIINASYEILKKVL